MSRERYEDGGEGDEGKGNWTLFAYNTHYTYSYYIWANVLPTLFNSNECFTHSQIHFTLCNKSGDTIVPKHTHRMNVLYCIAYVVHLLNTNMLHINMYIILIAILLLDMEERALITLAQQYANEESQDSTCKRAREKKSSKLICKHVIIYNATLNVRCTLTFDLHSIHLFTNDSSMMLCCVCANHSDSRAHSYSFSFVSLVHCIRMLMLCSAMLSSLKSSYEWELQIQWNSIYSYFLGSNTSCWF